MTANFYKQAVPQPCVVLGLPLRPLAVGHIILLHAVESAFVVPAEKDIDHFGELAMAVSICAQSYADALDDLRNPSRTEKAMAKWAAVLTRTRRIDRILRRKPLPIDIHGEWSRFSGYIQAHSAIPHYAYNPDDAREVACPPVQLVKAAIQRAFGFSDEVIMDRSWSQCLWDYTTLKAIDGQIQMTDGDAISEAQQVADKIERSLREKGLRTNGAP